MRDMDKHRAKMKRKAAQRAARYEKRGDPPLITANLSRNHRDAGKSIHGIRLAGCRA